MAKIKRTDLGFQGGQILSVRLTQEAYDGLRKALADERSGRWHDLKTEEAEVAVDLSQVVYLKLDTEEHRVGF